MSPNGGIMGSDVATKQIPKLCLHTCVHCRNNMRCQFNVRAQNEINWDATYDIYRRVAYAFFLKHFRNDYLINTPCLQLSSQPVVRQVQ